MDMGTISGKALLRRRDILRLGVSHCTYEKWKREGVLQPIPATRLDGRYAIYRRVDVVRLVGEEAERI